MEFYYKLKKYMNNYIVIYQEKFIFLKISKIKHRLANTTKGHFFREK